jgi:hypothetical protein
MLELIIYAGLFVVGMAANRAGAKWVRSLPDDSKLKRPGFVVFGGGGPKPVK